MSYSAVRRYPLGATSTDVTPGSSPDLVATWAAVKDKMRDALGEYKFADGSLMTFQGQRCPMATTAQANVVIDWLTRLGAKMKQAAATAGRSVTSMNAAASTFATDVASFRANASDSFGGRLPIQACYLFISAVDRYAIAMSAAQYAAFNTGTPLELWTQALQETPGGGALLGIWGAAKTAVGAFGFLLGNLGTIVKIALVGAAGLVGYRIYKNVRSP